MKFEQNKAEANRSRLWVFEEMLWNINRWEHKTSERDSRTQNPKIDSSALLHAHACIYSHDVSFMWENRWQKRRRYRRRRSRRRQQRGYHGGCGWRYVEGSFLHLVKASLLHPLYQFLCSLLNEVFYYLNIFFFSKKKYLFFGMAFCLAGRTQEIRLKG